MCNFLSHHIHCLVHASDLNAFSSDGMVQPQMDRDRFRNVNNLVLVKPNQIRELIHACN